MLIRTELNETVEIHDSKVVDISLSEQAGASPPP